MTFQRRNWTAERVAWAIMALIVVAALAGLFGTGPMSQTVIREGRGVEIEYGRFGQTRSRRAAQRADLPRLSVERGPVEIDQLLLVPPDLVFAKACSLAVSLATRECASPTCC